MKTFAPLPHEWMLASIIGFLISVLQVWNWNKTWGFTFALFFAIMFVASVVSMDSAGTEDEEIIELAVHNKHVRAGKHRRQA